MNNEKLKELLKDEAFVKELVEQETVEDAQKLLASKGVDISVDQLNEIRKGVAARVEEGEELSDEQLENVAGGFADAITAVVDAVIAVGDFVNTVTRRRW